MELQKELRLCDEACRIVFDKSAAPIAYAKSGDEVIFPCRDCYDRQIDQDGKAFDLLDMGRTNPVTGPLFVYNAEPGDVLQVDILSIQLESYGVMCVKDGWGIYPLEDTHCRRFSIRDGKILFDGGVEIAVKPMIGVIGTAPAEGVVSTQTPGEHGGNMDICELGERSTLFLPVAVPGALLSMGDLHAVQGDGETASCAMETSGQVKVRVTVRKDLADYPTPLLETEGAYYTTAADPSLDVCSAAAAKKMHRWLMTRWNLTDAQAAMLLSLQGNLRISQIVNPRKGCVMELKKVLLKQWRG